MVVSFIGILAAIAIFVLLSMKRVNLIISAVVAAAAVSIFSGINPFDLLTTAFMEGFSGFIEKFFLIFALGGVFGKMISESKAATKIAKSYLAFVSRTRHQKALGADVCALYVPIVDEFPSIYNTSLFC